MRVLKELITYNLLEFISVATLFTSLWTNDGARLMIGLLKSIDIILAIYLSFCRDFSLLWSGKA